MTTEIRQATEADFEQIAAIRREAFRRPSRPERWINGDGRVMTDGTDIQGIVQTESLGQYFGHACVSFCAVTSVAVAVPYRNQGVARNLLGTVLREQHADRVAMAALFPSSPALYRGLGFELAGTRIIYSAPAKPDRQPAAEGGLQTRWSEWSDDLLPEIAPCYERYARCSSGMLARFPEWWWEYVTQGWSENTPYCYRVYDGESLVGYAIYSHEPENGRTPYDFSLRVRDMAWTDGGALSNLISFLGGQWPYQMRVIWPGPAADVTSRMFGSSLVSIESSYPWMARMVNVQAALQQRGYPLDLDTSLRFEVHDPLIADNCRTLAVEVAEGNATVTDTTAAALEIDINTLAAMYTGWLSPRDAARLGLLDGASSAEVEVLELMFSGPSPWMPEFF